MNRLSWSRVALNCVMTHLLRITVLLSSLFFQNLATAGPAAWQEEFSQNFSNVEIQEIDGRSYYTARELENVHFKTKLSFVRFRETGWTAAQVEEHLQEVIRIYNTDDCRLFIEKVYVIVADPLDGKIDLDWSTVYAKPGYPKGVDLAVSKKFPKNMPRPIVSLFRSSYQMHTAYASPKKNATGFREPMRNTAWVTATINSESYKSRIPQGYNPIAHELAHIFFNHPFHDANDPEPNILSDHTVNDRILPRQCALFPTSGL